jgi:hypothetical protein
MLKTIRRLSIHLLRERTSWVVLAALSGGAVTMAVGAVTMAAEKAANVTNSSEPFRRPEQLSVPKPSVATSSLAPKGAGIQPLHIKQQGVMDGPGIDINPNPDKLGDPISGKRVYRYETFGNEAFWTDALRWLDGIKAAKVTPMDGLRAGFLYNTERIEPDLLAKFIAEADTDLSPENAPTLNDPATFIRLLEMNAVNGMPSVDVNGDGRINLAMGDKVGVSCSICHAVTDASILELPDGGSIGQQIDGPSALVLDMGQFLAWAANSKAYFPNLQVEMPGGQNDRPRAEGPHARLLRGRVRRLPPQQRILSARHLRRDTGRHRQLGGEHAAVPAGPCRALGELGRIPLPRQYFERLLHAESRPDDAAYGSRAPLP